MARQFKTFSFKAGSVEGLGEGEFAGYASVFRVVDEDGDLIQKGAFAATLPEFLKSGFIAWQHRWSDPIGKPLEAYEDDHGLFLRAKISDTVIGRDALTLIRDGVVTKLSIGYESEAFSELSEEQGRLLLGADYDAALRGLPFYRKQIRLLTQIKLYEASPVSVPANGLADIQGVKSGDGPPRTERELERYLREAGYSRSQAVAVVANGFKALKSAVTRDEPDQREAGDGITDADLLLLEHIKSRSVRRAAGVLTV